MPKYVATPEIIHHAPTVIAPPDTTDHYPLNPKWPPDPACFVAQEPIDCAELDKEMGR